MNQIVVIILFIVAAGLHVPRKTTVAQIIRHGWPFILIAGWCIASVLWSDIPALTLRRGLRFFLETATFILVGLLYNSAREVLRAFYVSFALVLSLDVLMLAVPGVSFTSIGYAGIHAHKNQAGEFIFLAVPILTIGLINRDIVPRQWVALLFFSGGLMILILTQSKSAWVFTPISAVAALYICREHTYQAVTRAALLVAFLILASMMMIVALEFKLTDLLHLLFGDATLTGRDQVWRFTFLKIDSSPVLGHGYGALWSTGIADERLQRLAGLTWSAGQAHNGYLDVVAAVGVVGLTLSLVTIARSLRVIRTASPQLSSRAECHLSFVAAYLSVGMLVYNLTESILTRTASSTWAMFVLFNVILCSIWRGQPAPGVVGGRENWPVRNDAYL